jgi:hypothetical protein
MRQTIALEVVKLAAGSSIRLQEKVLWHRGRADHRPNERRDYYQLKRRRCKSACYSQKFCPQPSEKIEVYGGTPGPAAPYQGTAREERS